MLNVLVIAGYLALSVGWFFLGHMLGFLALGRITKMGALREAARTAGFITAIWIGIVAAIIAISFAIQPETLGIAHVLIAGIITPLLYLVALAWLSHRFYGLSRGYSMLAAFTIGGAYLFATLILSVIVQMIATVVFFAHLASLA